MALRSRPKLDTIPIRTRSAGSQGVPVISVQMHSASVHSASTSMSASMTSISKAYPSQAISSAPQSLPASVCIVLSSPRDNGLCKAITESSNAVSLATLVNDDNGVQYEIQPTTDAQHLGLSISLEAILRKEYIYTFSRAHRYAVAAALVSAHLWYHSTPWLEQQWLVQNVFFPLYTTVTGRTLGDKAFVLAHFEPQYKKASAVPQTDSNFTNLIVLLLELCFGTNLELHALWQQPGFAQNQASPILRQAVAGEWLRDVAGEAGPDFHQAIKWTLKEAPTDPQDNKWRADFAANVVRPLQRCYESVKPK
ncbi:Uu.00g023630.m01.CDS01 [Anthostomella pinea]|uniref:Uu.00g023630.m01.CDS01 n=1 Tax=Anthostomella pinea TaxID=933095 RepID=A0AAI8W026_9PEZI|nr:Uu.00g023630.m01.CDS01 [Anthostomella pinea]